MKGFLGSGSSSGSKGGSVDTLIGRQTEILGDVRFSGGVHLDGRIKGTVSVSGGAMLRQRCRSARRGRWKAISGFRT